MLRKLAGRLTYSNVMATIAVFIALGAGAYAAVNLPRNSVKAKHIAKNAVRSGEIKNAQVKASDIRNEAITSRKLNSAIRPLHFGGTLDIDSLTNVILEQDGYQVTMACEDGGGGLPQLDGSIRVPEDGTLDLQGVTAETGGPDAQPAAAQVEVEAAIPFSVDVSDPAPGETRTTGAFATYSGATRFALLTIHGVADDVTDTCSLSGSIIPLVPGE